MRSVSITTTRLFLAISFGFFMLATQAQQNSPFTRFGLGEFYSNPHIISRAMGGLSAAYADGFNNNVGQSINFNNPATYANLYLVTYDLALTFDTRSLNRTDPAEKYYTNNFLPSYVAIGVPLKKAKGLGLAFGLKPLSTINYSVYSAQKNSGDSLFTLYNGHGGLNQVFVGLGKKWKTLSMGFNTGVTFGNKETNTRKSFINDTISYQQSNTSYATSFSGVFLGYGVQYEVSLKKKENISARVTENFLLRLGITGTLQQNLSALQNLKKITYTPIVSGDLQIDSIEIKRKVPGNILLPATYAGGITLHKTITNTRGIFELWSIGLEYSATPWTNYRFYDQPDNYVSDSSLWKFGLQFSPDPISGNSYWGNVNYRAGAFLGKDPVNADGLGMKHYGLSFGAGLPIRKWRSFDNQFTTLNTAFQLGQRGSAVNNITENYLQISLGFSFTDLWFIKRKYD